MIDRLTQGQRIEDRLEIIELLGKGGFGAVYEAHHLDLDRRVAIKFMSTVLLNDDESRSRFRREGRILSSLNHKNIVSCISCGLWQERVPYLVLEKLSGESLEQLISRSKGIEINRCLRLAIELADGIGAAHRMGVVHRDLKAANIFLDQSNGEETLKILDFGLSKILSSEIQQSRVLTKAGILLGSPRTMSPEQCRGESPDERSDIYAFGCLLFEMLSGEPPFRSESAMGYLHMHQKLRAPKLTRQYPEKHISPDLCQLVDLCLRKDPMERPQSMESVSQALRKIAVGERPSLPSLRVKSRLPLHLGALILALAALAIICLTFFKHDQAASAIKTSESLDRFMAESSHASKDPSLDLSDLETLKLDNLKARFEANNWGKLKLRERLISCACLAGDNQMELGLRRQALLRALDDYVHSNYVYREKQDLRLLIRLSRYLFRIHAGESGSGDEGNLVQKYLLFVLQDHSAALSINPLLRLDLAAQQVAALEILGASGNYGEVIAICNTDLKRQGIDQELVEIWIAREQAFVHCCAGQNSLNETSRILERLLRLGVNGLQGAAKENLSIFEYLKTTLENDLMYLRSPPGKNNRIPY